jgi:hypothetical protein
MTSQVEGAVAPPPLPFGLDYTRHAVSQGTPWPRRLVILLMGAFCVLALLNTFGQVATVNRAEGPVASLTVDSPVRLRGGLIFTSVITLVTHQPVQDAKVVLSRGWFDGMTLNAAAPQSSQEASNAQGGVFDYGQLDAGATMPIWISWQTNPTTVGGRDEDVEVFDGSKPLVTVHRSVVVFP